MCDDKVHIQNKAAGGEGRPGSTWLGIRAKFDSNRDLQFYRSGPLTVNPGGSGVRCCTFNILFPLMSQDREFNIHPC